ncbi:MAG: hypothetical protein ABI549_12925 [Flavobacterium sp.]|uniref:hypothetical protein n=1 Tax=Flavobacterium sp. TaxID=239 RepID=UPI0032671312
MTTIKKGFPVKIIAVVLLLALVCSLSISYTVYGDLMLTQKNLTEQKNTIIKELQISKDSLEIAISENSSFKTDLIIERQKVTNLLNEIKDNTVDVVSIIKYKEEVSRLKDIVATLTKDKIELKIKNDILKEQRDSTILVLANAKESNEKLAGMNDYYVNKVLNKDSKISVVNLKAISFKQSKKGEIIETDKASKVNLLEISFMVIGNKRQKDCDKNYYVQIIDSKNNVIGKNNVKKFGEQILNYSYESPVRFKNESLEVTAQLDVENIEKGNYIVNVFDKNELASKISFALR